MLSSNLIQRLLKNSVWPQLSSALIDNRSLTPEQTVGIYLPVKQGEDYDYFATRKMGHQLLTSPYETTWWNSSKYRLCLDRFDPLPRDARVLDVACGLGQASYFLAERVAEVTGVDLSSFAIQFAKKHYHRPNLNFVQADIFVYQSKVPADAVFCMDLLEHFNTQEVPNVMQRISNLLKSGGLLYAHVPIAESKAGIQKLNKYRRKDINQGTFLDHTGDPTHKSTFSVSSFKALLESAGFTVLSEIRKIYFWRPLRWLFRGCLALPFIPLSWHDQATYSYIVMAQLKIPALSSFEREY